MMWKMKDGDETSILPHAKGFFTMDRKYHHHYMLSTVTDGASFLSFIRDSLRNSQKTRDKTTGST